MTRSGLAHRAMNFARAMHRTQVRRYTGEPYATHLAEVAALVATVAPPEMSEQMQAVAWLHDTIEDQGVSYEILAEAFDDAVASGVQALSDLEPGNRATRKAAACLRLSEAPAWVQTIKVADLISNTPSIVAHDPRFARQYLYEMSLLVDALYLADERLRGMAYDEYYKGALALAPAYQSLEGV